MTAPVLDYVRLCPACSEEANIFPCVVNANTFRCGKCRATFSRDEMNAALEAKTKR